MNDEVVLAFLFFGCIGVAFAVAPLVLAIVATSRANRAARLAEDAGRQLLELRSRLARLENQGPARPTPAPSPTPASGEASLPERLVAARNATVATAPPESATPVAAHSTPPAAVPSPSPPRETPPAETRPAGVAGGAAGVPPAGAPPRPATPPPRPPSPPPGAGIRWEKLIGVGLTAVIGGGFFALAGVLFFRYAIEAGLISPAMRVVLGVTVGLAAIFGSEWLRTRRIDAAANALAGGGVVVLYAAFWAAHVLYKLVPMEIAGVLMALVTAVGALIATGRHSRFVAILSLAGGFATPLLLTSGSDRPIGLFGYVLLLDAAFLWIAWKRKWSFVALLALLGTFVLQGTWILARMSPANALIGISVLGVFALLFAIWGRMAPAEETPAGRAGRIAAQAGGVLVPFAFALYVAGNAKLSEDLLPLGALLFLLALASGWIGREQRSPLLPLGAAAGTLGVLAAWLMAHDLSGRLWPVLAIAVILAGAFHLFTELPAREGGSGEDAGHAAPAASLAVAGVFALLVFDSLTKVGVAFWPFIAAWAVLSAMAFRQGRAGIAAPVQVLVAAEWGAALVSWWTVHHGADGTPPSSTLFGVLGLVAVGYQAAALSRRAARSANRVAPSASPSGAAPSTDNRVAPPVPWEEYAAIVFPFLVILALFAAPLPQGGLWWVPATVLVLGVLAGLSATRVRSGGALLAVVIVAALTHLAWRVRAPAGEADVAGLALLGGSVLVFSAWTFVFSRQLGNAKAAWFAAGLAGPLWFLPLKPLWGRVVGEGTLGLLPVLLGVVSVIALVRVRDAFPREAPMRKTVLALYAAVALGFVSLAIPLQLEREWITIGWALEGAAVLAIWRKLDHPGLKWFGLALLAAVTVRLVANPAVLDYHPRAGIPILNWVLYTYLVPAAALLVAARLLRDREVEAARPWERPLLAGRPLGAAACGLAAIAVLFVWINLAVSDVFATGEKLRFALSPDPARDVARSIAWAVYAVTLLVIGMARTSRMLRWISLAVLLSAVAKVFLYDLGELEDLYRVASLLGLAICLILVSLFYQRFVFRRGVSEEPIT